MGIRDQVGKDLANLQAAGDGGLQTVSAQVIDVTDHGTVNLRMQGGELYDVPCTDAYRRRAAGDTVAVRRGAVPVVLWRLGEDPAAADEARTVEVAKDAAQDLIAISAYTWGTDAPPGTDWQQVTTLWTKKDTNDVGVLYAQIGGDTATSPTAPPTRAPKPVTLAPTSSGTWRRGRPDGYADNPTQGDWTGRGDRSGAWFYGTRIASACAGKTVAKITVAFTRQRGSGINGKVRQRLYLHNYTAPPSGALNLGDGPETLLSLSVGAKGTATLPNSWRDALASGKARGLAIAGHGRDQYAAFMGGQLTITFTAT